MTEQEKIELEYLIDLLREASKWNVDEGDDALRCEVDLRINRILSSVNVEDEVEVSSEPVISPVITQDDFKALEADRLNEHLASPDKVIKTVNKWKAQRVRCQENGHPVWHLRSECVREPRDNRNGGPAWTWKWLGPQDKKAQEEAMWAEHEQGE